MKKRIFNVTVGGYYVVSVVLGLLMALAIGLTLCCVWFDQLYRLYSLPVAEELVYEKEIDIELLQTVQQDTELKRKRQTLDEVWSCLPMTDLWDSAYVSGGIGEEGRNFGPVLMVVAAIATILLSIMIMEGKSANKAWRQKMFQAMSFAALFLLLTLVTKYTILRTYGELSTIIVMTPVILLIWPIFSLCKIRCTGEQETVSAMLREVCGKIGAFRCRIGKLVE